MKKLFLITIFLPLFVLSKTLDMEFLKENPNDYFLEITSLKDGDKVLFSNGKIFTIEKLINYRGVERLAGLNSYVIKVKNENLVLKLPVTFDRKAIAALDEFYNGWKTLKNHTKTKLKFVNIKEYLRGEYALVEYIHNEKFNGNEYIEQKRMALSEVEHKKIDSKLVKFIVDTREYYNIGDFHLGQIIWDGRHWHLLDWDNSTVLLGRSNPHSQFSLLDEIIMILPNKIMAKAISKIKEKQKKEAVNPNLSQCRNIMIITNN